MKKSQVHVVDTTSPLGTPTTSTMDTQVTDDDEYRMLEELCLEMDQFLLVPHTTDC
jgi:hypothetical protein